MKRARRDPLAASKALRWTAQRVAASAGLSETDLRVLQALEGEVLGWQRLTDELTVLQIAKAAGVTGGEKYQRRRVGQSLTALADAGLIRFPKGRKGGRGRGVVVQFLAAVEGDVNPAMPVGGFSRPEGPDERAPNVPTPVPQTPPRPWGPPDRGPKEVSESGVARASARARETANDDGLKPLTINRIESEAGAAAEWLLEYLGDKATPQTVDRLRIHVIKGTPPAAFHDARERLRTMHPPPKNPGAYACKVVDDYVARQLDGDPGPPELTEWRGRRAAGSDDGEDCERLRLAVEDLHRVSKHAPETGVWMARRLERAIQSVPPNRLAEIVRQTVEQFSGPRSAIEAKRLLRRLLDEEGVA